MSFRVKIYGAGSAGNHLAHASRSLGWEVYLCDTDDAALERTRYQIYPSRYGKWDESVHLANARDVPRNIYDLIIISSSPDSHIKLALDALSEKPKAVLVEKPFCAPDLTDAEKFHKKSVDLETRVYVGYNHVAGLAAQKISNLISKQKRDQFLTMDVEFREHWAGIFSAHPWLSGPSDTYLGSWRRGGGAGGEHSHATNLWQHFAHTIGAGRVVEVTAALDYVRNGKIDYDRLCCLNLTTEDGFIGRVVQDVVTLPSRKWGRIQTDKGYVEFLIGSQPDADAVFWQNDTENRNELLIKKIRPDDFIQELKHIDQSIKSGAPSPIDHTRGLDTMLVLAAAHKSFREKRTIGIDYKKGYSTKALK